jgi:hypothetical protein
MKRKKVIAVDFDGTVVKHRFPEIGDEVPHAVEVLKRLNEKGVRLIVWTMRCGEHLEVDAKDWFEERGIKVWAYNRNPEQTSWTESPKCYAHVYIDDAAIGCPLIYPQDTGERPFVDWFAVENILEESGFL